MKERSKKEFSCKNCKNNYYTNSTVSQFCSGECRKEYKVKEGKELGIDYVICQICNRATANVTGAHMRNHKGWTPERYKLEFPNSQIIASNVLEKIREGSVKAGGRMREDYHRERLRKSFSGERNPMHKSNTTEEKRKSSSPFSPDFYLSRNPNLSLDEAKSMARKKLSENAVVSWVKEEYWMNKGFTKEESQKIISKKQSTFSLEKCIEKYGEIEGKKRWLDRQEKWIKNYRKTNYSKKSQELFSSIYPIIKNKYQNIYFATLDENKQIVDTGKNHEYRIRLKDRIIMPDFYVEDIKKIIEFDGIYWHDYKRRNKPENQKREEERDKSLIDSGYSILRINEKEWENDPVEVIKKCMEFINS
jgi:hypothetical protein